MIEIAADELDLRLKERGDVMRKKVVAANWKMNMTVAEAAAFVDAFQVEIGADPGVEVVIIPPFGRGARGAEHAF